MFARTIGLILAVGLVSACGAEEGTDGAQTSNNVSTANSVTSGNAQTSANNANNATTPANASTPGNNASTSANNNATTGTNATTGPVEPALTEVLIAQGHQGRITVSCDGGQTWPIDQAYPSGGRCFDGIDCDHSNGPGRGVAFGDGQFMTTFGWGESDGVYRSTDGITWEKVITDTTFSGIAYGNGVWAALGGRVRVSSDGGDTWTENNPNHDGHVRRAGFAEGQFLLVNDGNVTVSSDGENWAFADVPATCGTRIQTEGGIVGANGVIVVIGGESTICYSTDDAQTFTAVTIDGDVESHAVERDGTFYVWGNGPEGRSRWSSPDGATWTATPTSGERIGPVTATDAGFAAVKGGWNQWYESQEFYWSVDGVTWNVVPEGSFTGSHPIRAMTTGYVDAELACAN